MSPLFTCQEHLENINKPKTDRLTRQQRERPFSENTKSRVEETMVPQERAGGVPGGGAIVIANVPLFFKITWLFFKREKSHLFKWIFFPKH